MNKQRQGFVSIILVFIAVILIGVIYFLVTQIGNLQTGSIKPVSTVYPSAASTVVQPTIAPSLNTGNYVVKNGDIYNLNKLIVNHNNFTSDSIDTFIDIHVSPNGTKLCFIGTPPGSGPVIYMSLADGSNVKKIGYGKNCFWSNNSLKIAYNNSVTDVSPIDVFVYDIKSMTTKNISQNIVSPPLVRAYSDPTWSSDDTKITSNFNESNVVTGEEEKGGITEFDLLTGKFVDR